MRSGKDIITILREQYVNFFTCKGNCVRIDYFVDLEVPIVIELEVLRDEKPKDS